MRKIESRPQPVKSAGVIDVALVGNPNSGKTSVFNALTGLRQKVGNYPGVTVERKTGLLNGENGLSVRLHDLPGLYSLVPKSLDDKIAADILTGRSPEARDLRLIVVVADASNLSRNLYLVTQIIELGKPVLLALNMMDVAKSRGLQIDVQALEKALGVPVIPLVANKGTGIAELRRQILTHVSATRDEIPEPDFPLDKGGSNKSSSPFVAGCGNTHSCKGPRAVQRRCAFFPPTARWSAGGTPMTKRSRSYKKW
ncbi:MAG: hypothetical protein D6743_08035 [Calditrichaeota bacterium]|nr:MAG: hypothetical protein D6743_08035 [Calditrichota bacterium]